MAILNNQNHNLSLALASLPKKRQGHGPGVARRTANLIGFVTGSSVAVSSMEEPLINS